MYTITNNEQNSVVFGDLILGGKETKSIPDDRLNELDKNTIIGLNNAASIGRLTVVYTPDNPVLYPTSPASWDPSFLTPFGQSLVRSIDSSAAKSILQIPAGLGPATTTALGTVIVGTGLSVQTNGLISVTSAPQLQTSQTFQISGGAVAAGVSFDGTAGVNLNVTSLQSSFLSGTIPLGNLPVATPTTIGSVSVPVTSALTVVSGALGLNLGTGLSINASNQLVTTNAGSVTSVGLTAPSIFTVAGSPVTGSGNLQLALATQNANLVFAGPSTGVAADPTFRSLVVADLPASVVINPMTTAGDLILGGSGGIPSRLGSGSVGNILTITGLNTVSWQAPATNGTVTSISLTGVTNFLGVTGSPVTAAGTLALSLATQSANLVFAGPATGTAAAPTFRSLVAADMPSSVVINPMTAAGDLIVGGTSGSPTKLPIGTTNGYVLTITNVTTGTLGWAATSSGSGTVTSVDVTGITGFITTSGGPITTTGSISLALSTQNANLVFAGPTTGVAAAPTFRTLVAADLPSTLLNNSSTTAGTIAIPGYTDTLSITGGNIVALGNTLTVNTATSVIIGTSLTESSGSAAGNNVLIGHGGAISSVGSTDNVAIGATASVTGVTTSGIAIGASVSSNAPNSMVLGTSSSTVNQYDVVLGYSINNSGTTGPCISIGNNLFIKGSGSIAIGPNTVVSGSGGISIGNSAASYTTGNIQSVCIGLGATSYTSFGIAIGASSTIGAGHTSSVALGNGSTTSTSNQVAFGTSSNTRLLSFISPGISATDAVNMSQLGSYRATSGPNAATYTFVLTDAGTLVNNAYATATATWTIPPNSSVAFPLGTIISIATNTGQTVTIAAGTGVTLSVASGITQPLASGVATYRLVQTTIDSWWLLPG